MKPVLILAFGLAIFSPPHLLADTPPQGLTLSFGERTIDVAGADPGSSVYIHGLAREPQGYRTSVVRREIKLVDDDRDGRVVWELDTPLPWRSIWFAADMTSGRYAAAAPPAYAEATRLELTSDSLKKDAAGEATQMGFSGSIVEFVVVRPKSGAVWRATVASGGALDEDTSRESVRISSVKLEPRAGTTEPPPHALKKDDVLFMVTSFNAQYLAVRIGEK